MNYILQLIYIAARAGRDWYWALVRPHLYGVRTVVVNPDNAILIVRHRAGPYAWVLPGGGVGRNEVLANAAAREIHEEAGITLDPAQLTYHGRFDHHHQNHPNTIDVLVCRVTSAISPAPPRYSIEIADARFVSWREIQRMANDVEPGCARRIEEVVHQRPPRVPNW